MAVRAAHGSLYPFSGKMVHYYLRSLKFRLQLLIKVQFEDFV